MRLKQKNALLLAGVMLARVFGMLNPTDEKATKPFAYKASSKKSPIKVPKIYEKGGITLRSIMMCYGFLFTNDLYDILNQNFQEYH